MDTAALCLSGLQGLYVCDAAGAVLSQQELEHQVILDLLDLADEKGEEKKRG